VRTAPPGRLLEVPVFLPDIHYGSVYQYYNTGPRRERPGGYSTTAPVVADVTARRLQPLNCGDWTTHPGLELQRLGVREIAFHRGLFVLNPYAPGRTWFAWRALVQHGYRPWAHGGAITILDRLHSHGPAPRAPVPEPSRGQAWLCSGWYANDGDGRAMSSGHASLWVYGTNVHLDLRSHARIPVRISVDGSPRLTHTFTRAVEVIPVDLGKPGWHLVSLDTSELPEIDGRKEGARLLSYLLG
jgi:hypothetical protein